MSHFVRTTLLLIIMSALVLLTGQVLGGRTGLTIALALSFIMNFGSYWYGDKIVLAMHRAVQLSPDQAPEIHSILDELAKRSGIQSPPKLYWIASATPNAFATGRNPAHSAIVVTQGLVQMLNHEELKGVIGHEMGHILRRDTLTSTIVATLAGVISYAAMTMRFSIMRGGSSGQARSREGVGNLVLWLVFAILMPIAAAMIQFAVSRTREFAADDKGAELSGNPLYLASALQKISIAARKTPMLDAHPAAAHLFIINPLSGANFSALFSTHPPVEKRIARLEAMAR